MQNELMVINQQRVTPVSIILVMIPLIVILTFSVGRYVGSIWVRKEAIKAGVAEWRLDNVESSAATFHWKTNRYFAIEL